MARLTELNRERSEAEARGQVLWLRPEFQGSIVRKAKVAELDLAAPKVAQQRSAWPIELAEQVLSVRRVLVAEGRPIEVADVARRYQRAPKARIEATLAALARLRGWAPKGHRCRASIPHGHWKTVTFVGGLTLGGFIAPMLLDGPMDGEVFRAWCEQMLAPALQPGHIVVMDNLAAHKVEGVRQAIEARGATLLYPAALQSRPQSHRERLCQTESSHP